MVSWIFFFFLIHVSAGQVDLFAILIITSVFQVWRTQCSNHSTQHGFGGSISTSFEATVCSGNLSVYNRSRLMILNYIRHVRNVSAVSIPWLSVGDSKKSQKTWRWRERQPKAAESSWALGAISRFKSCLFVFPFCIIPLPCSEPL